MAGLEDLCAQIPVQDIANKFGADEGEVNNAIRTLVPAPVAGLAENVSARRIDSSDLESAVTAQGASGPLDGSVSVDRVDAEQGDRYVAQIFGGNDSGAVASALEGKGAGGGDLIKQALAGGGGGLGSTLGGAGAGAGGGDNPRGSILGSVFGGGGGGQGNPIGEILGGLLGGKNLLVGGFRAAPGVLPRMAR